MTSGEDTLALVMGVVDFKQDREGFRLWTDHITRVQVPAELSPEDVQRMRRDFELLAEAIRDYPTQMRDLMQAHLRKDTNTSRKIAEDLGLSQESFEAQGGGIIWGVVAAAVVCDVFTGCLTSWAWNGV